MRLSCLLTILITIGSLAPVAHATSQIFIEPQQVPVGGNAYGVVLADFNGDGRLDMAVADHTHSSVNVLLGTSTGFGPLVGYGTGDTAAGIAVADFNRDGKLDLVTANDGGPEHAVSILLGNGDGSFQPQQSYPAANDTVNVVTADFNGDGNPDIAVGSDQYNQPSVTLLLGNGDGTFRPGSTFAHEGPGLAPADLNGDGKIDLVTNSGKSLDVFLGNGDGTF
ncbi:MAG: VCBS repeat-containing protein [Acidobacteriales bacterium]|nr:VCBS repeat-containing protein [Terriglobales bacterium]